MQRFHLMTPQSVVDEINARLKAIDDANYQIEDEEDIRIVTFLGMFYEPLTIKLGPMLENSDATYTFELLQIPSAEKFNVEIGEKEEDGEFSSFARSYLAGLRAFCRERGIVIQVTPEMIQGGKV